MPTTDRWRVYAEPHGHTYIETADRVNVAMIPSTWHAMRREDRQRWARQLATAPVLCNMVETLCNVNEQLAGALVQAGMMDKPAADSLQMMIGEARIILRDLGVIP